MKIELQKSVKLFFRKHKKSGSSLSVAQTKQNKKKTGVRFEVVTESSQVILTKNQQRENTTVAFVV